DPVDAQRATAGLHMRNLFDNDIIVTLVADPVYFNLSPQPFYEYFESKRLYFITGDNILLKDFLLLAMPTLTGLTHSFIPLDENEKATDTITVEFEAVVSALNAYSSVTGISVGGKAIIVRVVPQPLEPFMSSVPTNVLRIIGIPFAWNTSFVQNKLG